jgi:MFS family permease
MTDDSRRSGAALALIAAAQFVLQLDFSIVNVALPTIQRELGFARTRALGVYQGATAAGASAGIVLGGVLTQYVGWRAIFLVNPPVIVLLKPSFRATTLYRSLGSKRCPGQSGTQMGAYRGICALMASTNAGGGGGTGPSTGFPAWTS